MAIWQKKMMKSDYLNFFVSSRFTIRKPRFSFFLTCADVGLPKQALITDNIGWIAPIELRWNYSLS